MYAEQLYTPHPNKSYGLASQPLLEVARPRDTRQTLDVLASQEVDVHTIDHQIFIEADRLSKIVYGSLWFRYDFSDPPLVTEERVAQTQETSCFGYTIVLSECLEQAGIKHWIAFANNHGFIVVPNSTYTHAYLANPSQPKLNGFLAPQHFTRTIEGIHRQVASEQKSALLFNTDAYVHDALHERFCDVVSLPAGGWLTFESEAAIMRQYDDPYGAGFQSKANMLKKRRLLTTLYTPEIGRQVLEDFSAFQYHVAHNDFERAQECLDILGDNYPEVDTRNKQKHLYQVLGVLLAQGAFGSAVKIIETFGKSMERTHDKRAHTWRGDLYRQLGSACKTREILELSKEMYMEGRTESNAAFIETKLRKTERLINQLD